MKSQLTSTCKSQRRFLLGSIFKYLLVGFSLTLASINPLFAVDHHGETPRFKITDISANLKMLQGKGGNVGLLTGKQGIVLIDDDYAGMSSALSLALAPYGGVDKLTYIINTHWHGDHTGGNNAIGQYAPIVAHENVRQRLLTRQEITLFGMVSEPYPAVALPSLTYREEMSLHINEEQLVLMHLPSGHTDGDSIVLFKKANVIHLGDHFFNGFYPFVDVENGGNVLMMTKNLQEILPLLDEQTVIIPGHGPLGNKADLIAFIGMLSGTAAEVQVMKDAGLSLKAMQAKGLTSQWESWSKGMLSTEAWVSIINASLK